MKTKVTSTIDLSDVLGKITDGGRQGLTNAVEYLLTEANKSVPHDEGTLERSGHASVDDSRTGKRMRGAVSYDTPYAVRQHEDMEYRHDGKGKAKWLENTLASERGTVGKIVATAMGQELGT